MASPAKKFEPVLPDNKEAHLADESSRILASYIRSSKSINLHLIDSKGKQKNLIIPTSALRLFVDVLTEMGKGNAVTLTPIHAELTTQEAAELLNVSRPYFVKLLDAEELPYRKVGTKRRVLAKDVLQYKSIIESKRQKILDELTRKSQEMDLGYK